MADITKIGRNDNPNFTEGELLLHEEQQNAQAETQESEQDNRESVEQVTEEVKTDWEKSAKHFQSEKDKMFAENQQLKKQLDEVANNQQVAQQVEEEAVAPPEEFDPWEAYNDPNSESYAFRQKMEEVNIAKAVASSQKHLEDKMQSDKKLQEFDNQLTQQGLSAEEKQQFYNFANTPLSNMGTDKLVAMWRAADGRVNTPQNASGPREFEQVRKTQQDPTPAGVLQGEQPPAVNEVDETWNRIMSAQNRTRIIK
jgi:hypothetical protein